MSVLVDTSFFVSLKSLRDKDHRRATELFQEILRGELGTAHTTNFIFAEAVTASLARTHRHSAAVGVGELIHARGATGVPIFGMHHVSPEELHQAWDEFRRYREKELSLTDWTSVVVARSLEADAVLSFDQGFDGIHARLA
jgi:predicted nucleic acid-binding protein